MALCCSRPLARASRMAHAAHPAAMAANRRPRAATTRSGVLMTLATRAVAACVSSAPPPPSSLSRLGHRLLNLLPRGHETRSRETAQGADLSHGEGRKQGVLMRGRDSTRQAWQSQVGVWATHCSERALLTDDEFELPNVAEDRSEAVKATMLELVPVGAAELRHGGPGRKRRHHGGDGGDRRPVDTPSRGRGGAGGGGNGGGADDNHGTRSLACANHHLRGHPGSPLAPAAYLVALLSRPQTARGLGEPILSPLHQVAHRAGVSALAAMAGEEARGVEAVGDRREGDPLVPLLPDPPAELVLEDRWTAATDALGPPEGERGSGALADQAAPS